MSRRAKTPVHRNRRQNRGPRVAPTHQRIKAPADSFDSYVADLRRRSGRLLTPEREDSLGRLVRTSIRRTTRSLAALLENDRLLAGAERLAGDTDLKGAEERTTRWNPSRLEGKELVSVVKELLHSEQGFGLLKTYDRDRGGRAIEALVNANLRLVISMARKHHRPNSSMTLLDLIQEGTFGLLIGALRFDERLGYRFSTYACHWIRHVITRALQDKSRLIRIPVHALEMVYKAGAIEDALMRETGRPPKAQEVAGRLLAVRQQTRRGRETRDDETAVIKKLQTLQLLTLPHASLQTPMYHHNDGSGHVELGDVIADPSETQDRLLEREALKRHLHGAMEILDARERDIVCQRFGLSSETDTKRTLAKIGEQYDLSRERVRQILQEAVKKLRNYFRVRRIA